MSESAVLRALLAALQSRGWSGSVSERQSTVEAETGLPTDRAAVVTVRAREVWIFDDEVQLRPDGADYDVADYDTVDALVAALMAGLAK